MKVNANNIVLLYVTIYFIQNLLILLNTIPSLWEQQKFWYTFLLHWHHEVPTDLGCHFEVCNQSYEVI